MAPDASHDDVKRAFTDLALKWHPDRQSESSADARERAEWRMQEINAAWVVLRSPASRAAYDDELATASQTAVRSVPAQSGPGSRDRVGRVPSFADQLVDPTAPDVREVGTRGRRLRRWAPVLVIVALVAVLSTLAILASRKPSTPPPPGVELQTEQFQVGSCVVVLAGPQAMTVPCDEPNSGQIKATTDYPRPCPPETISVALVSRQISLCLVPT